MTTYYLKNNNEVRLTSYRPNISDKLKPAVYVVLYDENSEEYYLERKMDAFQLPDKIYTNNIKETKILKSFENSTSSMGVLTTGLKGTGKTLFNKTLCNELIKKGYPVLLIENNYFGEKFNIFLETINKCVIFFDEFGKIYNDSKTYVQEYLLGLLDGSSSTCENILFLFSDNGIQNINEFLLDRPGRIKYWFKYNRLDIELLKEYCYDNKINKKIIDDIILVYNKKIEFSFDMLKAIVDDYLLFNESIPDIVEDLNIEIPNIHQLKVTSIINSEREEIISKNTNLIIGDPLQTDESFNIIDNNTYTDYINQTGFISSSSNNKYLKYKTARHKYIITLTTI